MKAVKFNDEEIDLLMALYEDELREAESYIDKLKKTLKKLKNQADQIEEEFTLAEKKKEKPQKDQLKQTDLIFGKKSGRKPKVLLEETFPVIEKKGGRKSKMLQDYAPLVTMIEDTKSIKKRKGRKPKKHAGLKHKAEKIPTVEIPTVEIPVIEEIKPV